MNITFDQIVEWIIAILPSVIAVLSFVAVTFKSLKEFRSSKLEVLDFKDITEARKELKETNARINEVLQENYELKKYIKELLTKIDKVQRK